MVTLPDEGMFVGRGNVWLGEDFGEHGQCPQTAEEISSRRGFKLTQCPKCPVMEDTKRESF